MRPPERRNDAMTATCTCWPCTVVEDVRRTDEAGSTSASASLLPEAPESSASASERRRSRSASVSGSMVRSPTSSSRARSVGLTRATAVTWRAGISRTCPLTRFSQRQGHPREVARSA